MRDRKRVTMGDDSISITEKGSHEVSRGASDESKFCPNA